MTPLGILGGIQDIITLLSLREVTNKFNTGPDSALKQQKDKINIKKRCKKHKAY